MLGRLILTTVGTSSLDKERLQRLWVLHAYQDLRRDLQNIPTDKLQEWIDGEFSFAKAESFVNAYVESMLEYDIAAEVVKPAEGEGINIFSAEISSLHLIYEEEQEKQSQLGLDSEQDVHILLLSQTPEGILSGILIQNLLSHPKGRYIRNKNREEMESISPKLVIVPGLQVKNFNRFFREGLPSMVKRIREFASQYPTKKLILNITGGFKATVAFSSYLALAFQIPMVFLFEELTNVVKIEPPQIDLSTEQQEILISGIRQMVAEVVGLESDDFDLIP